MGLVVQRGISPALPNLVFTISLYALYGTVSLDSLVMYLAFSVASRSLEGRVYWVSLHRVIYGYANEPVRGERCLIPAPWASESHPGNRHKSVLQC